MNFALSILIVTIAISSAKAQTCKTPIGESGQCVPTVTCSIIADFMINSQEPLPPKFMNYLEKSYCDFRDNTYYSCCAERHITKPTSTSDETSNSTTTNRPEIIMRAESDVEDIADHPSLSLLPQNRCGRIGDDKISNGNNTAPAEFPWMVLLQYGDQRTFRCAGSLISPRYVLTAAHCVTRLPEPLVSVRLGEYNTSSGTDCEDYTDPDSCLPPVQDILVEEAMFHPQFNRPRFANDVAVIRLQRDANIQNENVLPICLPITEALQSTPLSRVTISGWGLTETKTRSDVLQKAVVPVVANDACQRAFKRSARITSSQMCAGGENGVDSCSGDSGGPLFYTGDLKGLRYVQYGIISFGLMECGAVTTNPGIYARVAFYMKWILDQMKA